MRGKDFLVYAPQNIVLSLMLIVCPGIEMWVRREADLVLFVGPK